MTSRKYFSTMSLPSGKVLTLLFTDEASRNAVSEAARYDRLVDARVEEFHEYRNRSGDAAQDMLQELPDNV